MWPSHVGECNWRSGTGEHFVYPLDVRTQADYQQMDPNFVGLIFSCFGGAEKVICLCICLCICF